MIRFVTWAWLGLVVGVSFVATPIKFTAESLTRPVALDVGQVTFHLLNRIEWALAAALIVVVWRTTAPAPRPPSVLVLTCGVVVIVVLQTVWLLPELDDRTAAVIAGADLPASPLHTIFGVLEVAKVATLGVVGYRAGDGLASASRATT